MSSLAYPGRAARSRLPGRRLTEVLSRRGADVLIAVALSEMVSDFNVDSWLALVTGRLVWQSGIPHRELLTMMSYGHPWIDQQWLSQLASYALYRLGGLSLLGVVNVALIAAPVFAAVFAARSLGAPFRSVLLVLPACLAMITPSREIRTQEFAIPLFVAVVILLATDSRRPSRRVLWCLPLLALWANLHGSATLGAGLVGLRGLTMAWERRTVLRRSLHAWCRPLALVLGAPAAILATPYGLAIIGYYRTTMGGSTLRQFVTEWRPVTSAPVTATALFLTAALALWSFGRNPRKTSLWDKLAFLVLVAGSISVVRNCLFCGLFALVIVPVSWNFGAPNPLTEGATPVDRRRAAVNGLLALAALALVALSTATALRRSDASIQSGSQSTAVLTTVARVTAAHPALRVLADGRVSDWLLWRDPELDGRIADDARFELLTAAQLTGLQAVFEQIGTDWKRAARGYRLLVLLRSQEPGAIAAFRHEPGARVLLDRGGRVVILRSARQAARG
jgi:hypothetical protein